jgi:hypothetical protein
MNQQQFACPLNWAGTVGATGSLIAALFPGAATLVVVGAMYSVSALGTMLGSNCI